MKRTATHNRRLAKKRVQCLNEALCFVSSSVLADSLVPRNPLLRQAPKRCAKLYPKKSKKMLYKIPIIGFFDKKRLWHEILQFY